MTAQELRRADADYQRDAARAERARTHRNLCITQALAEGWTHAQIAEATGLTRGRIGQLAS